MLAETREPYDLILKKIGGLLKEMLKSKNLDRHERHIMGSASSRPGRKVRAWEIETHVSGDSQSSPPRPRYHEFQFPMPLPNKSLMNDYFFLFSSIIVTLILTQDYFSAGLFYQIIWIRIILVQLFFLQDYFTQDYFSTKLFYLQDYLI